MGEIIRWASLYIGMGFMFVIVETIRRIGGSKEGIMINRIKVIAAWLPAMAAKA